MLQLTDIQRVQCSKTRRDECVPGSDQEPSFHGNCWNDLCASGE